MRLKLEINNYEVKRDKNLLDENLTWKQHIKYIENEISKIIDLLHKAEPFLNKQKLYIHSYINYANVD